jgi:hypothetical protein
MGLERHEIPSRIAEIGCEIELWLTDVTSKNGFYPSSASASRGKATTSASSDLSRFLSISPGASILPSPWPPPAPRQPQPPPAHRPTSTAPFKSPKSTSKVNRPSGTGTTTSSSSPQAGWNFSDESLRRHCVALSSIATANLPGCLWSYRVAFFAYNECARQSSGTCRPVGGAA